MNSSLQKLSEVQQHLQGPRFTEHIVDENTSQILLEKDRFVSFWSGDGA